jgi:hypothetical protein
MSILDLWLLIFDGLLFTTAVDHVFFFKAYDNIKKIFQLRERYPEFPENTKMC